MSTYPLSAVKFGDVEINIAKDLLDPKMLLPVEALKTNIHCGYLYKEAKRGIDEEVGQTRVTRRHLNLSSTVVVEPIDTLVQTPERNSKASPEHSDCVSPLDSVRTVM